ncbi:MAG: alpha/beta fold hydrolase [Anaerolineales bacterium]
MTEVGGKSEHILERDGCPIHYWVSGLVDRPLLVFMHGATMDHRMFDPQVDAFASQYRVLVWDARGHGKSQPLGARFSLEQCAQDMIAILDTLGISQAVLCGQSLGGYIAQHIYRIAPELVQAMVIIGSTPIAKAYSRWEVWALKASLPLFRLWPYNHFTQTIANSTAQTPAVRAYALQAARQIAKADFVSIWQAVTLAVDEKGDPSLRIDVPLLLIHGDNDRAGTIRRDMPQWAKWEKEATYQVVPNAAHNANQDNPEFTNQIMLAFLQKYVGI